MDLIPKSHKNGIVRIVIALLFAILYILNDFCNAMLSTTGLPKHIPYRPRCHPVIYPGINETTSVIIFFHGIGDTGHGWYPELLRTRMPFMKVVCPTAKMRGTSINNGIRLCSWYDKKTLNQSVVEDIGGLKNATVYVHYLINKEIREGIPAERIFVGGYAQGGVLAFHSAISYPKKLAGCVTICAHIPNETYFFENISPANRDIPTLHIHGKRDPIINHERKNKTMKDFDDNQIKPYLEVTHIYSKQEERDMHSFFKVNIDPI